MRVTVVSAVGMDLSGRTSFPALANMPDVELTAIVATEVHPFPGPPWSTLLRYEPPKEDVGYRLEHVPVKNSASFMSVFQTNDLRHALRNSRPDIVDIWAEPSTMQFVHAASLCRVATPKAKVLFWATSRQLPELNGKSGTWWRTVGRNVVGGHAVNTFAIDGLKRAGYPGRLKVKRTFRPCPVSPSSDAAAKEIRRRFGIEPDTKLVGYVGRVVWEKGLVTLLAAIRRVPDAHCLIVGNGPFLADLELMAASSGIEDRVHFAGAVPGSQVPNYMRALDILVMPSLTERGISEQFGRAIGEAMACSIPVIGSDSGAIPEVIDKAGLIFSEGDHRGLAEAIQSLVNDDEYRRKLAQAGHDRWNSEFSSEAVMRKFRDLYSGVLENHGVPRLSDY